MMIQDVIQDVQNVPGRLAEGRKAARRWVRAQLWQAREQGETRLWNLHLQVLEGASSLVERAASLPMVGRVSESARSVLEAVERATTTPPLEGYDELNVRVIMKRLHELDRFELLRLQHHERTNKGRKTVLDAVEREVERRARVAASL